jgi:hypothetical protein
MVWRGRAESQVSSWGAVSGENNVMEREAYPDSGGRKELVGSEGGHCDAAEAGHAVLAGESGLAHRHFPARFLGHATQLQWNGFVDGGCYGCTP